MVPLGGETESQFPPDVVDGIAEKLAAEPELVTLTDWLAPAPPVVEEKDNELGFAERLAAVAMATLRILKLLVSEMYRFPALSNAMSCGKFNCALAAGPPSPENPAVLPTTVVMIPAGSTRRIL